MRRRPAVLSLPQEAMIARVAERLPETRREDFIARVKSHLTGASETGAVKAAITAAMEWEGENNPDTAPAAETKRRRGPWHLTR
jgi:hypothetical protein